VSVLACLLYWRICVSVEILHCHFPAMNARTHLGLGCQLESVRRGPRQTDLFVSFG